VARGKSPKMVVMAVSITGRNRTEPARIRASKDLSPLARSWLY
jgi:hypothetical protein